MTAIRNGDDDVPRPAVYQCPSHPGFESNESKIHPSLYALVILKSGRQAYLKMVDRRRTPTARLSPWTTRPELTRAEAVEIENRMTGPRRGGKFQSSPWLALR